MPPVPKTISFPKELLKNANWLDLSNFLIEYTKMMEKTDDKRTDLDHAYQLGYDDGFKGRNVALANRSDEWNEIYKQGFADGEGDREFGQS